MVVRSGLPDIVDRRHETLRYHVLDLPEHLLRALRWQIGKVSSFMSASSNDRLRIRYRPGRAGPLFELELDFFPEPQCLLQLR